MKKRVAEKAAGALKGSREGNRPREFLIEPTVDEDGVQASAGINQRGEEVPDPVPTQAPIGHGGQPQLDQLIKQYVRREMSELAQAQEYETFDEADDFEIEDDPLDPLTEYERVFDPPLPPPPEGKGDRGGPQPFPPESPPPDAPKADSAPTPSGKEPPPAAGQ